MRYFPKIGLPFDLKERRTEYLLLLLATLIQGFTWFLVIPVLPLYARHLGAQEFLVGVIMSVPALLQLFLSIPSGLLSARFGKRRLIILSFWVNFLSGFLYIFSPSAWFLLLAQFLFGLGNTLFWPLQGAYLTQLVNDEERSRVVGFTMGVVATSFALAPFVAGGLADLVGFGPVFWILSIISLLGGVLVQRLPCDRGNGDIRISLTGILSGSFSEAKNLLKSSALRFTNASTYLTFLFWGTYDAFYPLFVVNGLGYSPAFLGFLVTSRNAMLALVRFFVNSLGRRFSFPLLMVGSLAIGGMGMFLLPWVRTSHWLILLALVTGVAVGILPTATTLVIAANTDDRRRATALALDGTSLSLGRLTSAYVFGYLAQRAGIPLVFRLVGLTVLLGILVLGRLHQRASDSRAPTFGGQGDRQWNKVNRPSQP
ncbi:MAG: MFS transporter [Firmicutes bacterium]|nr:MFS transporter [Bacillota bacterium]MCL5040602.1 MFS transporter [Bacillota bacterium]